MSGIRQSIADSFIKEGIQVTVLGRRKERLDAWVLKHRANRVHGVAFDISQLGAIPQFMEDLTSDGGVSVTSQYPDIKNVFINSSVQQATDFTSPKSVELAIFHQEMYVHYVAAVSIVHEFLPFPSEKMTFD